MHISAKVKSLCVAGHAGPYRLPLPLAGLTESGGFNHPAPRPAEGGLFIPSLPYQTRLFTKFPQTQLLRKLRQVGLKFHGEQTKLKFRLGSMGGMEEKKELLIPQWRPRPWAGS